MTCLTPLGQQRLLEIVGRITQRPETWDQRAVVWSHDLPGCGCVAWHSAGRPPLNEDPFGVMLAAQLSLEATDHQGAWLFRAGRTLAELQRAAIEGEVPA